VSLFIYCTLRRYLTPTRDFRRSSVAQSFNGVNPSLFFWCEQWGAERQGKESGEGAPTLVCWGSEVCPRNFFCNFTSTSAHFGAFSYTYNVRAKRYSHPSIFTGGRSHPSSLRDLRLCGGVHSFPSVGRFSLDCFHRAADTPQCTD